MSYTALEAMRQKNLEHYGKDLGPFPPPRIAGEETGTDLKSAALRFLDERCTGLRFSPDKEKDEADTHTYLGASLSGNQIPYNMQMDIDRLCLKNELAKFIDSGVAEDAYTVYYAYLEMFIGEYGRSQSMVELLSEFESNASSLLMKHRDHYSHSVYVFALGLAIYEMNPDFRKAFISFYSLDPEDDHAAAAYFLKFWGLTSLFHDIGYPFEIPFEQVISYFADDRQETQQDREKGLLYIAYNDLEQFTAIGDNENRHLKDLYGRSFSSVCDLLAHGIYLTLGSAYDLSEQHLLEIIESKPMHPDAFKYFMDHAFFSAVRLFRELVSIPDGEPLTRTHVDALTAIMLHNSMFKFAIAFYKDKDLKKAPLRPELHPLAWLLMLCDELQCWDRTAYGRNSRSELHPMSADFHFSGHAIHSVYHYDIDEKAKVDEFWDHYTAWKGGNNPKKPRLKDYSEVAVTEQPFRTDIESIVDLTGFPLLVDCDLRPADRKVKHTYLSSSNFLHIYDFAVALNARYNHQGEEETTEVEKLESEFKELSLEYKLLNINQVRSFARYLNAIDCFYTDKPVDFDILKAFTQEMIDVFAPMEHVRWVRDHQLAGWRYGDEYESLVLYDPEKKVSDKKKAKAKEIINLFSEVLREQFRCKKLSLETEISEEEIVSHYDVLPPNDQKAIQKAVSKILREQFRRHKLTMNTDAAEEAILAHYYTLSPEDQGKDWLPFNSMLKLLQKFDGLRIYTLE